MAQTKLRAVPKPSGSSDESELSDGQLLGRFNRRRDESAEAAFAVLIRRHGPMVLRVCDQILGDRHDAEDAFQACFLVLARRSGSIRRPELLGNWLYGVALRTAREAKMRDGQRKRHETPASAVGHREPAGDPGRSAAALITLEEREALHAEVARLPERFRVPLVLCELEGLTYQEVARRLQCPVSTIGVRLIRARERLRVGMIRRGIAPATATALATALFGEGDAAALSMLLVDSTAKAAVGFAAADAVMAGLIPSATIGLAEAVLLAIKLARLQVAASALLIVGLATAPGWLGADKPVPSSGAVLGSAPPRMNSITLPAPQSPISAAQPTAPIAVAAPSAAQPVFDATEVNQSDGRALGPVLGFAEPRTEPAATLASTRPVGREELTRGETLFFKEWVANDPMSPHGDGLGPVFNETSCVSCHGLGAPGGAGPENKNVVLLTASVNSNGNLPRGLEKRHPGFGTARSIVLHRYGTDTSYSTWRRSFLDPQPTNAPSGTAESAEVVIEAKIRQLARQSAANPRRRGAFAAVNPAPGISLRVSERNSPALFGAGQIDSITAEVLDEQARWEPEPLRGRVNRARDGRVGRFGWKAQIGGLHDFVRSACASELGLEVPGHAQAISPIAPLDRAKGLDLTEADCDALVAYVRALPAPVVVDPDGPLGIPDMAAGRHLFAEVGCASCHAPTLGQIRGIYSDLLLHDLGSGLGDAGTYYGGEGPSSPTSPGDPSPGEWRTPPLWGFRDSGPYLHDGRAENLEEAVAFHEGQAASVTRKFFALSSAEQAQVETFLKSLVAPSTTSAPGIILAADLESRVVPEATRQAEALTRLQRERSEAGEVLKKEEARLRQVAEATARRAQRNFQLAVNLERAWKLTNAIKYYREVVREAPDTEEGRVAGDRIADLTNRTKSADHP